MSRPTLEVADIVRRSGQQFLATAAGRILRGRIARYSMPSSAATPRRLGGHRDQCVRCGHQAISYNSCRNRHCPRCQGNARARWLAARSAELLPVSPSSTSSFATLPRGLALVLQNKQLLYDLLYRTSAAAMLELARDPRHLGADIGFTRRAPYMGAEP